MKIKKRIMYLLVLLTMFVSLNMLFINILHAQGTVDLDTEFETDDNIGLAKIEIPFFGQPLSPGGEYATVLSWASFFGILFTIGLGIFWVYLLFKAGLKAYQSEGSSEGLSEAYKKTKSIFIGAGLTIAFPILISIVGVIVGVGPFWTWPKAFRDCPNSADYNFYFQAALSVDESVPGVNVQNEAEAICYGAGGGPT